MYYTATVKFETIDDRSGRTKTIKEQYLVAAESISEAETKLTARFKDSIAEFAVASVQESKIMDVLK